VEKWTPSKQILLFVFVNDEKSLKLSLYVGPGLLEIRQKLINMAKNNQPLFNPVKKSGDNHSNIYSRIFLEKYEGKSDEEIKEEIEKQWANFFEKDFPQLDDVLKRQEWLEWPADQSIE
jgi:hypothetical protein